MYRSRVILSNFDVTPENIEPLKPMPHRKGITITIRGIITPQDREHHEKILELIPGELGIKYINEDDKKYFESQYFHREKIQYERMVIEWRHDKLEDVSDNDNPIFKTFYALRLLKEGPVFMKYLYTVDEEKNLFVKNINFEVPDAFTDYQKVYRYELKTEESQRLKEIFDLLYREKTLEKNIDLALDRFNSTYYLKPVRDVLLDIMIAFEALFLRDYRGNRKGEALAIACSMLLGKTKADRKTIMKTLSKFYRIRNHILHGSSYDDEEIKDNFYTLRNYLRRSIIALLA